MEILINLQKSSSHEPHFGWNTLIFSMELHCGKEIQVCSNKVSGIAKTFKQFWRWKQVSDTGPMGLLFLQIKIIKILFFISKIFLHTCHSNWIL